MPLRPAPCWSVPSHRAMLVGAFANDSLNSIQLTPLRERLTRLLATRLSLDLIEGE